MPGVESLTLEAAERITGAGARSPVVDWEEVARRFAAEEVRPAAAECDRRQRVPRELIDRLAELGILGAPLPVEHGGGGCEPLAQGLIHREIAKASASVQGVVNVHQMGSRTIARWGTPEQKRRWLPRLASGELLIAFAVTEPEAGSDLRSISTTATPDGAGYRIDGVKRWITCGQVADVFLVLAASDAGPVALLVERDAPGLEIRPLRGLLGCRGYMLSELEFDGCGVPADHLVGQPGFGASHVVAAGLESGRFCLSWACLGIGEACLEESVAHAHRRIQFGRPLRELQLVERMIADMVVKLDATRLLCQDLAELRAQSSPLAVEKTYVAKYFASTSLVQVASDTVQILGALGCVEDSPAERYLRDSKIMEIIEGTTQIHQIAIANLACARLVPQAPRRAGVSAASR